MRPRESEQERLPRQGGVCEQALRGFYINPRDAQATGEGGMEENSPGRLCEGEVSGAVPGAGFLPADTWCHVWFCAPWHGRGLRSAGSPGVMDTVCVCRGVSA